MLLSTLTANKFGALRPVSRMGSLQCVFSEWNGSQTATTHIDEESWQGFEPIATTKLPRQLCPLHYSSEMFL